MKFLILTLLLICANAFSAEGPMNFFGNVIEPPSCKINNGENIYVDFGNKVGVNKVDGINYLEDINYNFSCESESNFLDMTLTIIGGQTGYDSSALQTNNNNLGIKILVDGRPFVLNKPIVIEPKNPPKLQAVPIKRPGSDLTEGAFSTSANLLAQYQ